MHCEILQSEHYAINVQTKGYAIQVGRLTTGGGMLSYRSGSLLE